VCRLKIVSVLLSLYCFLLCEVNLRNQNYFSRPHENKTFPLPYCREIKLQILKKKIVYILIYIVRGCNVKLRGLQPLSSCHAWFRNATLTLRPTLHSECNLCLQAVTCGGPPQPTLRPKQCTATAKCGVPMKRPPPLWFTVYSGINIHWAVCVDFVINRTFFLVSIVNSLSRHSCFYFICSQFLNTLLKSYGMSWRIVRW
jgi:hypothetical protein